MGGFEPRRVDGYPEWMASRLVNDENDFRGCFGCGSENPRGLGLAFVREGDTVVTTMVLAEQHAGYRDFAHGGIVATLLDEAMGWAMLHFHGEYGVTSGLRVEYRRPVRIGSKVIVRANVVSAQASNVCVAATVEDERGRTLARGEGQWVVVRRERAAAPAN